MYGANGVMIETRNANTYPSASPKIPPSIQRMSDSNKNWRKMLVIIEK